MLITIEVNQYNFIGLACRLRVFENKILRQIFGPKRDENREWRSLHNEELHSLYRSPNTVRVIKSRRLTWDRASSQNGRS